MGVGPKRAHPSHPNGWLDGASSRQMPDLKMHCSTNEATPLSAAARPLTDRARATGSQLAFNLVTAGLGTGIFTLPWSTAGASVLPAVGIIAAVLALNAFTISIIVHAAERHATFDLGGLLGRLPGRLGPIAQSFCNAAVWFSTFLCLVSYLIVVVDCVQTSVSFTSDVPRSRLVGMASVLVLPLCYLDQRALSTTSLIAVIANICIFVYITLVFIDVDIEHHLPQTCVFGMSSGSMAMVCAMMQTVIIQMCVLPMYAEMQDRSPEKFDRVVLVGFTTLFFLCAGVSVLGYLTFGPSVHSNVLIDLPSTPAGHIAKLSAALGVMFVFPIVLSPMIAPLQNARSVGGDSHLVITGARCFIVFSAMVVAMFVRDLGFLNVVNGALSLGVFVALTPSLVGVFLLGPTSHPKLWRAGMCSLAFVGLVASVLGFSMTDNYEERLITLCAWPSPAAKL